MQCYLSIHLLLVTLLDLFSCLSIAPQDLINLMEQPFKKINILFKSVMNIGTVYRAHKLIQKYLHCIFAI